MNGRGRVIVTGASTGIGEATALHLRELGFSVLARVRRDEDAERLREQGLTPIRLDITVAEQPSAARAEIGDQPLAGLVNNAGITRSGPLEFVPVDDLRGSERDRSTGRHTGAPRRTARRPRPYRQCGVDLGTSRDADNRSLRRVEIRVGGNDRRPTARVAFAGHPAIGSRLDLAKKELIDHPVRRSSARLSRSTSAAHARTAQKLLDESLLAIEEKFVDDGADQCGILQRGKVGHAVEYTDRGVWYRLGHGNRLRRWEGGVFCAGDNEHRGPYVA